MATISTTALARATAALERARQAEEAAKQAQAELKEAVNDRRLEVARLMFNEQVALGLDDSEFIKHMRGLVERAKVAEAEEQRKRDEAKRKRAARKAKHAGTTAVKPSVNEADRGANPVMSAVQPSTRQGAS